MRLRTLVRPAGSVRSYQFISPEKLEDEFYDDKTTNGTGEERIAVPAYETLLLAHQCTCLSDAALHERRFDLKLLVGTQIHNCLEG